MHQPNLFCTTFNHVKHLIGQIFQITNLLFSRQLLFIWILQISCCAWYLSCLFVSRISQKVEDRFGWNLVNRLDVWQEGIVLRLLKIQIPEFLLWFFNVEWWSGKQYIGWYLKKLCTDSAKTWWLSWVLNKGERIRFWWRSRYQNFMWFFTIERWGQKWNEA